MPELELRHSPLVCCCMLHQAPVHTQAAALPQMMYRLSHCCRPTRFSASSRQHTSSEPPHLTFLNRCQNSPSAFEAKRPCTNCSDAAVAVGDERAPVQLQQWCPPSPRAGCLQDRLSAALHHLTQMFRRAKPSCPALPNKCQTNTRTILPCTTHPRCTGSCQWWWSGRRSAQSQGA